MKTQPTNPRRDAAAEFIRAASRSGAKPMAKRPRRSAAELQRERDQHFFLLKLAGYTLREIGKRSNMTHAAVHAAIKRIPEPVKDQLRSRILATG